MDRLPFRASGSDQGVRIPEIPALAQFTTDSVPMAPTMHSTTNQSPGYVMSHYRWAHRHRFSLLKGNQLFRRTGALPFGTVPGARNYPFSPDGFAALEMVPA
jgi:hypothetical protein